MKSWAIERPIPSDVRRITRSTNSLTRESGCHSPALHHVDTEMSACTKTNKYKRRGPREGSTRNVVPHKYADVRLLAVTAKSYGVRAQLGYPVWPKRHCLRQTCPHPTQGTRSKCDAGSDASGFNNMRMWITLLSTAAFIDSALSSKSLKDYRSDIRLST